MIWIVIGGLVVVAAIAAFATVALRRAARSAVSQLGAPTPIEAKIESDGAAQLARVGAEADKQKQEVANANGPVLLDLARKRLLGRK